MCYGCQVSWILDPDSPLFPEIYCFVLFCFFNVLNTEFQISYFGRILCQALRHGNRQLTWAKKNFGKEK